MSAAGPPQGARPPAGERREATQGGPHQSAAGPPQGARPPAGERREATQGGPHQSAAGPPQGARPPAGERREATQGGPDQSAAAPPSQGARPPGERREATQGGPRPVRFERADFILGAAAIVLALAYLVAASTIPESILADAVGAAGVPKLVGWAIGVVGMLICVRSIRFDGMPAERARSPQWRAHALALGLLGLLVAYVVLAPLLGYPLSIALLTGGVAWYAGAPFGWRLCVISIASGMGFWLLFATVFGLPMPAGELFGGR